MYIYSIHSIIIYKHVYDMCIYVYMYDIYASLYLSPDGPGASVVGEAKHGVGAPVGLHPVSVSV